MNVTFHVLLSVSTAAVLSAQTLESDRHARFARRHLFVLAVGFITGVGIHGLLDYLPHAYPIPSAFDVILGIAILLGALVAAQRGNWLLLVVCFVGALFPDFVDLGPAIANRRFGMALPVVTIFPWHWHQYSGSVYDGSHLVASMALHVLVLATCVVALVAFREKLFLNDLRWIRRRGIDSE